MTISLMPLPYSLDALAPHVSAETLEFHHGAHHKGYVDKVNEAVEGKELADKPIEEIVKAAKAQGDAKLFHSAAQVWNHGFYWRSLAPRRTEPSAELASAVSAAFGSIEAMLGKLNEEAVGHFGSGWAWLVAERGALKIISTHDAETPITGAGNPLLTIDVWEHAYYIDVRHERPAYVDAVLDNLVNWTFASENFARGTRWVYPS